jgi:hypothetical protein
MKKKKTNLRRLPPEFLDDVSKEAKRKGRDERVVLEYVLEKARTTLLPIPEEAVLPT